jgi:hypothetical protein
MSVPFGVILPFWKGLPPVNSNTSFDTTPVVTAINPNTGLITGGTAVTVRGNNFIVNGSGAGVSVRIDGILASSVVVVDTSTITCVTPVGVDVGVVDVTVTNAYGQTGTLYGSFTFYQPTILSIAPAFGPFSGGTTVILQGYNFDPSGAYSVFFGDDEATLVTVIDSQQIQCLTPPHATGFTDVILTSPNALFSPSIFDATIFDTTQRVQTEYARLRSGFQYTLLTRGEDIRRMPGIIINDILNNSPNTCNFTVDGTSNTPICGEKIEITDSFDADRLLFAGTVQSVVQRYEGQTDQLAWDVTAIDFTFLMNRKRPTGVYRNISASDVVKDLIAKFALGFTSNHVQTKLAKVTVILDGSKDLATVLSEIAGAIGGGHWYCDYTQDLHFFHIVPANLSLPPSNMPAFGSHTTIAAGASIPAAFNYEEGFYALRHTFVYSDGTESELQPISNILFLDGSKIIQVTGLPTGSTKGMLTCTKRRVYYSLMKRTERGFSSIETVLKYAEVGDNTTTSFSSWFGSLHADVATVGDINVDLAIPKKSFNGHATGPTASVHATVITVTQSRVSTSSDGFGDFWNGGLSQYKVAFLYRDGSVSFPGPASNTTGVSPNTFGTGVVGVMLNGIPIGSDLNGNDVVARLIYTSNGKLSNPGVSSQIPPSIPIGFTAPGSECLEPSWSPDTVSFGVYVIPNNSDTSFVYFYRETDVYPTYPISLTYNPSVDGISPTSPYGYVSSGNYFRNRFGASMKPYDNGSVLSSDPIPVWPNPDGPSLEDVDPPEDIDDLNDSMLHEDTGSQPFSVTVDISQVRNRVQVVGSGSIATKDAQVGDVQIFINDIANFSPSGGQVRALDPNTGVATFLNYDGIAGTTGAAGITLTSPLRIRIVQGTQINNWFQAEDFESQRLLAATELDVNGRPTDGIHEYVIVDGSLKAVFQLYMRAYAELELFGKPIVTIRYATRDPKSRTGQMVHVDLTDPPCQGDFLIQEVTIDQIHDESDQLFPRYTVTASSVKFELNDLLLQIIGQALIGGSGAGVVTSAISQSNTNLTSISGGITPLYRSDLVPYLAIGYSGLLPRATLRSWGQYLSVSNTTNFTTDGVATTMGTLAVTGGPSNFDEPERHYIGYLPSSNRVYVRGNNVNSWCRMEYNPFIEFVMKFPTGGVTHPFAGNARFWLIVADFSATLTDTDSIASIKGVGMRYSQVAGDTGLRPWNSDGSTQTLGSALTPLSLDKAFTLAIRVTDNGTKFTIYVNGVSSSVQNIPAAALGVNLTWFWQLSGGSGSTWFPLVSRIYLEND